MALFTDGPPSSIEQLTTLDSQLLTIASSEGIDVTRKLELAQEELALDLQALLQRAGRADGWMQAGSRQGLDHVVVTAALRLWHAYRTLEMTYSDAYNSQLNDRYQGKRDQFHAIARSYRERLLEAGVGIASLPVPRAAAVLLQASPGSLPDNVYYVTAAWVNGAGEEGASANPETIATSSSTFAAQLGQAPANIAGWNVYVGVDPYCMTLQNSLPLEAGAAWVQPVWIDTAGRKAGDGQAPSYVQALPRMMQRG